jgi:hypothetical protein
MLPVRSAMARDNSRIACWPFVNEYRLHKQNLPPGPGVRINSAALSL